MEAGNYLDGSWEKPGSFLGETWTKTERNLDVRAETIAITIYITITIIYIILYISSPDMPFFNNLIPSPDMPSPDTSPDTCRIHAHDQAAVGYCLKNSVTD